MMIQQKVAHCTPDGDLQLMSNEVFDEICWEFQDEIFSMPQGLERLQKQFKFANFCLQTGRNKDAFCYYRYILQATIENGAIIGGYELIALEVYKILAGFSFSDDEYIWESSLTIIDCYGDLFENTDDV